MATSKGIIAHGLGQLCVLTFYIVISVASVNKQGGQPNRNVASHDPGTPMQLPILPECRVCRFFKLPPAYVFGRPKLAVCFSSYKNRATCPGRPIDEGQISAGAQVGKLGSLGCNVRRPHPVTSGRDASAVPYTNHWTTPGGPDLYRLGQAQVSSSSRGEATDILAGVEFSIYLLYHTAPYSIRGNGIVAADIRQGFIEAGS